MDYYVLKNEKDYAKLKYFFGVAPPQKFEIVYPYEKRLNTFLIKFDNGWEITFRIHTASSRISKNGEVFMTEKLDPICKNLKDVIQIQTLAKHST